MPKSLLDLPREIRDEIYNYVFVSPTGYIESIIARYYRTSQSSNSSSKSGLSLYSAAVNPDMSTSIIHECPLRLRERKSIALARTCKLMYEETKGLLWAKNTFYIPLIVFPQGSTTIAVDPSKLFRAMGQFSSRLITSICLNMIPHLSQLDGLARVLQYFASRSRYGSLRRVELLWTTANFKILCDCTDGRLLNKPSYGRFVEALRRGSLAGRYEKRISLPMSPDAMTYDICDSVAETMHCAFGGSLFWGDMLGWQDGVKVGGFDWDPAKPRRWQWHGRSESLAWCRRRI